MGLRVPTCLSCDESLPLGRYYQGQLLKCGCTYGHEATFFPAALRVVDTARAAAISSEHDASCFQHAEAAAEAVCSACGSYMCGVCATISPEGESVCLPCLNELSHNEEKARWRREWINWDTIALHLSLTPFLFPFFYYAIFMTAPAAAAISIWKWNYPQKRLIPRGRARLYVALGLSVIEILFIVGLIAFFVFAIQLEDA